MRGFKARLVSASKSFGRLLTALLFTGFLVLTAVSPWFQKADASHGIGLPHLFLMWDGTDVSGNSISLPSGWSPVNTYNGRFPRGAPVSDFGNTGGGGTHTPTVSSVTTSVNTTGWTNAGANPQGSTPGHTHPAASVTVGAASNSDEPAYRSVNLIQYNGIPAFIPNGVIAMFDTIPSSGWTQQTAFNNRFIKFDSTITNGGSDTHTHSLDWSGLGAAAGTIGRNTLLPTANNSAADGHTHGDPNDSTTAPVTSFPPHVQPLIAKANGNTTAIPANLLGFFDQTPGSGWIVRSKSSGTATETTFYQQFLRVSGASFNGTTAGSASHTHANEVGTTDANTTFTSTLQLQLNQIAMNHTHILTAAFDTSENVPQYVDLVIAEKINFIQRNYRWFEDPGFIGQPESEDVTDPWSPLDVAELTPIPAIPSQYNPPEPTDELRLRIKIDVAGDNLPANDIAFTIQYKEGTDANCTTGSWTDVGASGSGSIWRFAMSGVADGAALSNSRFAAPSTVLQTYNISNPTNPNPNGASIGNSIEYDFHLEHNGAADATKYSFRLIESTGPLLAEYATDACPTLTTKPGTENQLRHGNFFEGGVERGFSWVD